MLAVNLAAGVTGAIFMFAAAQQAGMSKPWVAALVWLFFWPRMWAVRSVGSPETLFIAGIISSVYFFNRKMYWWSALGAIVAVVTKSPGILLILAYGLWATEDYLKNKRWEKRMYPVFLAGLALAGMVAANNEGGGGGEKEPKIEPSQNSVQNSVFQKH